MLKGYGVTIALVGDTFIKHGVTSSTFHDTPDVPFESFELTLPRGDGSALAANGNLCRQNLVMPTRMIGQNGKVLEDATKVKVEGCKPAIYVVKKQVHGAKATIVVHVPSAGKLIASGRGIAGKVKKVKGKHGANVSITVKLTGKAISQMCEHHRRATTVLVHLTFKRAHGKALKAKVRLRLK